MDIAENFARPSPVRQAARVSTAAIDTADTDRSLTRRTRSAVSSAEREEYSSATTGFANRNSPTAHGMEKASVSARERIARFRASASSPLALAAETAGTVAAASP